MSAKAETLLLQVRLSNAGIFLNFDDTNMLRKAQITLHRWAEQECGDGNDYASWSIERDENTGIPYRCVYPHDGKSYRTRIPDREAGALKRIADVCNRNGLHFYHQGDPRGCALYVSKSLLTADDYTRGVPCC